MSEVVDLLNADRPMDPRPKMHEDMERHVAILQGVFPADMTGFIVMAVGADGKWSMGWSVDPDAVIGRRMLGGLALAAITEELLIDARLKEKYGETGE